MCCAHAHSHVRTLIPGTLDTVQIGVDREKLSHRVPVGIEGAVVRAALPVPCTHGHIARDMNAKGSKHFSGTMD